MGWKCHLLGNVLFECGNFMALLIRHFMTFSSTGTGIQVRATERHLRLIFLPITLSDISDRYFFSANFSAYTLEREIAAIHAQFVLHYSWNASLIIRPLRERAKNALAAFARLGKGNKRWFYEHAFIIPNSFVYKRVYTLQLRKLLPLYKSAPNYLPRTWSFLQFRGIDRVIALPLFCERCEIKRSPFPPRFRANNLPSFI